MPEKKEWNNVMEREKRKSEYRKKTIAERKQEEELCTERTLSHKKKMSRQKAWKNVS